MKHYMFILKSKKYPNIIPVAFVQQVADNTDMIAYVNQIEESATNVYPKYDLYVSQTTRITGIKYNQHKENCTFKNAMLVMDSRVKEAQKQEKKERFKGFWESFIFAA